MVLIKGLETRPPRCSEHRGGFLFLRVRRLPAFPHRMPFGGQRCSAAAESVRYLDVKMLAQNRADATGLGARHNRAFIRPVNGAVKRKNVCTFIVAGRQINWVVALNTERVDLLGLFR